MGYQNFRVWKKNLTFAVKNSSMEEKIKALEKYNFWGDNAPNLGFIRTDYTDKIFNYTGSRLVKVLVGQAKSSGRAPLSI